MCHIFWHFLTNLVTHIHKLKKGGINETVIFKNIHIFLYFVLLAGVSTASPIFVGDSSSLTGQSSHQDTSDNVNILVDFYNATKDPDLPGNLTLLGKWDVGSGWDEGTNPGFTGSFIDGSTSGDWFANEGWLLRILSITALRHPLTLPCITPMERPVETGRSISPIMAERLPICLTSLSGRLNRIQPTRCLNPALWPLWD